jgi:ABC-type polar amino acid transport system ATPase subunit
MDGANHALHPRFASGNVATALKDTPVVLIDGPRQCGKTTLVRSDPSGLVRSLGTCTIDEVQRALRQADVCRTGFQLVVVRERLRAWRQIAR